MIFTAVYSTGYQHVRYSFILGKAQGALDETISTKAVCQNG